MNNEIIVILDRSGSMCTIQGDMEGGLNSFVAEQKLVDDPDCKFTFVTFDNEYEIELDGVPLQEVPALKLVPRGSTALLDAVGRTLVEVGLRHMNTHDGTSGKVIVLIITDGQENASQEFKLEQVKDMIETQRQERGWQIIYLGADVDAFAEAGAMGVIRGQTISYDKTPQSTQALFATTAANATNFRSGIAANMDYTEAQREEIKPAT